MECSDSAVQTRGQNLVINVKQMPCTMLMSSVSLMATETETLARLSVTHLRNDQLNLAADSLL